MPYIVKLCSNHAKCDLETLVDMVLLLVQSCILAPFAVTLSLSLSLSLSHSDMYTKISILNAADQVTGL
jgi:hypothetical protein